MSIDLRTNFFAILQETPNKKYYGREIAHLITQRLPEESLQKKNKSKRLMTDKDLVSQISAEIASLYPDIAKTNPDIKITDGKPRQYYFSLSSDVQEVQAAEREGISEESASESNIKETNLYPILSEFMKLRCNVLCMRIDEKKSRNKNGQNGNKWLHPDMVGLENLTTEWMDEVKSCVAEIGGKRSRLWSFEVKLLLNSSNLRESFFQAVSNSSWANYSYLVAGRITGSNTTNDLRMLCSAHSIGLILLDTTSPEESEILIPAPEKNYIDWDSINRVAEINSDFSAFVRKVKNFHLTGEIHP
jgi:hypothetical protein